MGIRRHWVLNRKWKNWYIAIVQMKKLCFVDRTEIIRIYLPYSLSAESSSLFGLEWRG